MKKMKKCKISRYFVLDLLIKPNNVSYAGAVYGIKCNAVLQVMVTFMNAGFLESVTIIYIVKSNSLIVKSTQFFYSFVFPLIFKHNLSM